MGIAQLREAQPRSLPLDSLAPVQSPRNGYQRGAGPDRVSGLTCQEGEEEVSVDPDTLKADVVVISEPDGVPPIRKSKRRLSP